MINCEVAYPAFLRDQEIIRQQLIRQGLIQIEETKTEKPI